MKNLIIAGVLSVVAVTSEANTAEIQMPNQSMCHNYAHNMARQMGHDFDEVHGLEDTTLTLVATLPIRSIVILCTTDNVFEMGMVVR